MNIVISKSDLKLLCLEVFFILSFAYITYASNIYIVWGNNHINSDSILYKEK